MTAPATWARQLLLLRLVAPLLLLQEPEHRDQADHSVQEAGAGISYIILFLLLTMGDTTWTGPGAAGSALCPLAPALLAPSLLTVDTQPDPAAISILYIHQCNCL